MENNQIVKDKPQMGKKQMVKHNDIHYQKSYYNANILLEKLEQIQYGQTLVVAAHKMN